MSRNSDILENDILAFDPELLSVLLIDRSKSHALGASHNIIWATDTYAGLGEGYSEGDEILPESISKEKGTLLRPRVNKSREEQEYRSRDRAEVFTPVWICNKQNNLIDSAWFEGVSPFNTEDEDGSWHASTGKIPFPTPSGKTWEDYVKDTRMEMACGEAPYLVSRYDVVTGADIKLEKRTGILDRKLRVVCENTEDEKTWNAWVETAYKSTYGFEWQGDNLLLAREALLYTFFDYHKCQFSKMPTKAQARRIAEIISWNLWQMDALKGVIPDSCHEECIKGALLFGEDDITKIPCPGCQSGDIRRHNGIYCIIKDWEKGGTIRFIDLLK